MLINGKYSLDFVKGNTLLISSRNKLGGNNEGLFRGAILQSGAPVPVESEIRGQRSFDVVAKGTNCYTALDKIACLRAVPYEKLHAAISKYLLLFTLP